LGAVVGWPDPPLIREVGLLQPAWSLGPGRSEISAVGGRLSEAHGRHASVGRGRVDTGQGHDEGDVALTAHDEALDRVLDIRRGQTPSVRWRARRCDAETMTDATTAAHEAPVRRKNLLKTGSRPELRPQTMLLSR